MRKAITASLKSWNLRKLGDGSTQVSGFIVDDTKGRFRDGSYIYSSQVTKLPGKAGLVHTLNSVYKLDGYKV